MNRLKIGICGSGFIASHHWHALNLLPNVEVTGIYSRNQNTAKELIKRYNPKCKYFSRLQDLIDLNCDAISICMPNYLHKEIAVEALNSGANILVEKPLARNVREGKEMLDAAKSAQKQIFYCENNIYAPSFRKVKEIIDEEGLGDIFMGRSVECHSGPHSSWFYKKDLAGGGALLDLGIHDVACFMWYLDLPVESVFCQTRTVKPFREEFGDCEVEDNALGVIYFENGAQIAIEESWTVEGGYHIEFELFGEEGQIKASPTHSNLINVYSQKGYGYAVEKAGSTKGWTYPVPDESYTFGYPQEMNHFVDCMLQNTPTFTDGKFGLQVLNIVESMYKSARTNKLEYVSKL